MKKWIKSISPSFVKLLPHAAYPILRGPLRGAKFRLGALAGKSGGASVYFNMIEPEQTAAIVNALESGQTFFDIGANVGYYTLLASRLVGPEGRVVAFEPVVRNIAYLHEHVLMNRINNVTVLTAACSDSLTLQHFSLGVNCAQGHLAERNGAADTLPVMTISLDEVVDGIGLRPDVMKIDVEGAELSVLKGAEKTLQEAKPKIFLSTHSDTLTSSCLAYLEQFGYECAALDKKCSDPKEFLATHTG